MKKYILPLAFALIAVAVPSTSALEADIDPLGSQGECVSIVNNLRYKSRDMYTNGEVSTLQDFLQVQGYLNSEPTGYFGLFTLRAVMNFQASNNIQPTGYVGPITRGRISTLTNCLATVTSTPVERPVVKPTPTPVPTTPVSTPSIAVVVSNEVMYAENNSVAFITTSIGKNSTNKQAASWKLSIQCSAGIKYNLASKTEKTGDNLCGTTWTYYSSSYYDINQGVAVIAAGATNKGTSDGTITYKLIAYNAAGATIGSGMDWVKLSRPSVAATITSISPMTAKAGDVVYVYGTNFHKTASFVAIDGDRGTTVRPNKVEELWVGLNSTISDGMMLSFTVPSSLSAGKHTIQVGEKAGSVALSNKVSFTIEGSVNSTYSIKVTSPSSGQVLTVGQTSVIRFTDTREKGDAPTYVITLVSSNGKETIADYTPAPFSCAYAYPGHTCSYEFTPTEAASWNVITIYDVVNDPNGKISGSSSAFVVEADTQVSLTITNPKDGYWLTRNNYYPISWKTTGIDKDASVYIELVDSGGVRRRILEGSENIGSFSYYVADDVNSKAFADGEYSMIICAEHAGENICDIVGPITISDKG